MEKQKLFDLLLQYVNTKNELGFKDILENNTDISCDSIVYAEDTDNEMSILIF